MLKILIEGGFYGACLIIAWIITVSLLEKKLIVRDLWNVGITIIVAWFGGATGTTIASLFSKEWESISWGAGLGMFAFVILAYKIGIIKGRKF